MNAGHCPLCGHRLREYANPVGITACTNDSCYFRCNSDDFSRLSAAMEYTKCQAELARDYPADEDHEKWLWEEGKKAWARVKEVFGV